MHFVRKLFDLSRPEILSVDYIGVLIQDKKLLLLSWRLRRHNTLTISVPGKKRYKDKGAILLKLPDGINHIDLTTSSLWRKRRKRLHFKSVQLDSTTARQLMQAFNPVPMPFMTLKDPDIKPFPTSARIATLITHCPVPHLDNMPNLQVHPFMIEVLTEACIYKPNHTIAL